MAKDKEIPLIPSGKNMISAVSEMNKKKLGLVCFKEKNGMINILTDGDIRRNANNLYKKKISKICTKNPNWISDSATALSAIEIMNSKKITSLLVGRKKDINKKIKKVIGIIHMHHCLARGIK
jgi:arabinose-5-phosphate isomerase